MCVCVCVWGGGGQGAIFVVVVVVFNGFFSNSELNSKSFSCQTNRIWKNIFVDNIYANIFILHTKGKPVYQ